MDKSVSVALSTGNPMEYSEIQWIVLSTFWTTDAWVMQHWADIWPSAKYP